VNAEAAVCMYAGMSLCMCVHIHKRISCIWMWISLMCSRLRWKVEGCMSLCMCVHIQEHTYCKWMWISLCAWDCVGK
jgi:hypothetical protein